MELRDIFQQVLNMSLTGSLVICCVLLTRLLLHRAPKVFSYALWAVVLFRLLCPVSLTSSISLLGLVEAPVTQAAGPATTVTYFETNLSRQEDAMQTAMTERPVPSTPEQTVLTQTEKTLSPEELLAPVWLVGMCVMALAGTMDLLRLRWRLIGSVRIHGDVYIADHIDTPFVLGLFRPRIYLPSDVPMEERRYIVAHERHHIRRKDHILKLLAYGALCIHWFNPLVWVAFAQAGKDMEMSCDEAVIRKLGAHIRADYSASLLRLATGRRIIAGAPLAFGEGDTKGRVINMVKWKKPKVWVMVTAGILCVSILAACAVNPAAIQETADPTVEPTVFVEPTENPATEAVGVDSETEIFRYQKEFTNAEGSATFRLDLNYDEFLMRTLPVLTVTPRELTSEDAQRIAKVLFGDAEFLEAEPEFQDIFSKQEIQDKLDIWNFYSDKQNLVLLYGAGDEDYLEDVQLNIEKRIAEYEVKLISAPTEPHKPCEWTFKSYSEYYWGYADPEDDCERIQSRVWIDGIPYLYIVEKPKEGETKCGWVYAEIDNGLSPDGIDSKHYLAALTRTQRPTQEQINTAAAEAQSMLDQMGMGEWLVDKVDLSISPITEDITEYIINVEAVPVMNGIPCIRGSFTAEDEIVMSNAWFNFNAEGVLLGFQLDNPMEVLKEEQTASAMDMESLFVRAEEALSAYPHVTLWGTDVNYTANITELQLTMGRVKTGEPDVYEYRPALAFRGELDYDGGDGDTFFGTQGVLNCLVLDLEDGSVISTRLPE